uniref:Uncharacterized protein n=1 Tax=Sphaerodactylus townsendi TaxID=933632 RepID=A0ACB8EGK6_9SAUR
MKVEDVQKRTQRKLSQAGTRLYPSSQGSGGLQAATLTSQLERTNVKKPSGIYTCFQISFTSFALIPAPLPRKTHGITRQGTLNSPFQLPLVPECLRNLKPTLLSF